MSQKKGKLGLRLLFLFVADDTQPRNFFFPCFLQFANLGWRRTKEEDSGLFKFRGQKKGRKEDKQLWSGELRHAGKKKEKKRRDDIRHESCLRATDLPQDIKTIGQRNNHLRRITS